MGELESPTQFNMPSIGSRLGPYEIVSALGAGGIGEVYRARGSTDGKSLIIGRQRRNGDLVLMDLER
jgi:hypothetical protein